MGRVGVAALSVALALGFAGCGFGGRALPVTEGQLLQGWARPRSVAAAAISLAQVAAFWWADLGTWRMTPGRWHRDGDTAAATAGVSPSGWSWSAAAFATEAAGLRWPSAGTPLYAAPVAITGEPGWPEQPSRITLWAAVRAGTVVASWVTCTVDGRTLTTVYDEGPTVFTLAYWSDVAPLTTRQRAVVPAGLLTTGAVSVQGAPVGTRAVTFAEGLAAWEALVIPARTPGRWRFVPLGPAGSALSAVPYVVWGDETGTGGTDATVYYDSGAQAQGMAIYALARSSSGWGARSLFAADGNLAMDIPGPHRARIVVLGLWGMGRGDSPTAYQTVVWHHGNYRLGPGLNGPAPPGALPPGARGRRGAKAARAPDVQGLSWARALRRLAASGLGVQPVVPVQGTGQPGTVVWQWPRPGAPLSGMPGVSIAVATGSRSLAAGRPPALQSVVVRDARGSRAAGPAALRAWRREVAWLVAEPLPVMRVVRGPGDLNGTGRGRLLLLQLQRPWRLRLPATTGRGTKRMAIDTLAFSDQPMYAGWLFMASGGAWVAAAHLSAPGNAVLRALLRRLAP